MDEESRSDTWPDIQIHQSDVTIEHEATVGRVGEEQLFFLMSRGLSESEALAMIVNGFIEPVTKELPMEYAVELNRLIQLEMSGRVGQGCAHRRHGAVVARGDRVFGQVVPYRWPDHTPMR